MKAAVLVYSNKYKAFNIGDYIQSIAAKQYFEYVDMYLNREKLNEYDGEFVKIILNGWFMHDADKWPPKNNILPLFISFHINSVAKNKMLSASSIEYLKKYAPIGCRDKSTVNMLREKSVNAYFSGCLTLTLGNIYKRTKIDKNIYFVDPYFKYRKDILSLFVYMKTLLSNYSIVKKIALKMYGSISIKTLIKSSSFYKCYSKLFSNEVLKNANYLTHVISNKQFIDDCEKFNYANNLLTKYSAARYVVTSRIHCALPCLGMGTPVLYVDNQQQEETSSCRLDGLLNLLHVIKCDGDVMYCDEIKEKITGDYLFNNKNMHIEIAEKLKETCSLFIENSVAEE
jgi:hypothetical protein